MKLSGISAALLTAGCLLFSSNVYAASNVISEAGIFAGETVSVEAEHTLDYASGVVTLSYTLTNTGSETELCYVDVPTERTLSTLSEGKIYTVSCDDGSITETISPLLSSVGVTASTMTEESLRLIADYSAVLEEDVDGVLCTLETEAEETPTAALTVTALGEDGVRVYPIHCSYTSAEGVYSITPASNVEKSYVFLSGIEEDNFSLQAENSAVLSTEQSSLSDFLALGVDAYLEETETDPAVTKDLLLSYLYTYINSNGTSISLDIIPSLQWMARQPMVLLDSCEIQLEPQASATVKVEGTFELSPEGVSIDPTLLLSGRSPSTETISFTLPDGYERVTIKNTLRVKTAVSDGAATVTLTQMPDKAWDIVLDKELFFTRFYRYLVPMSIAMVIFLIFCLLSYMGGKKRKTENQASDSSKS